MSDNLMDWLKGRDETASRSYDFIANRPFWKTRWFWIIVTAVCICLLWFLWPA